MDGTGLPTDPIQAVAEEEWKPADHKHPMTTASTKVNRFSRAWEIFFLEMVFLLFLREKTSPGTCCWLETSGWNAWSWSCSCGWTGGLFVGVPSHFASAWPSHQTSCCPLARHLGHPHLVCVLLVVARHSGHFPA